MATLPTAAQLTGNVTEGQFKSGINQLLSYLSENVGANGSAGKQVMTVSGVWTVPEGVTQVYVSQCGGGGGGSAVYGCGGGAGAGVYRQPVTVTPGETIACTVGAGGLGNTSNATSMTDFTSIGATAGTDGTTTSFGGYVTTPGGKGGYSSITNSSATQSYYGGDGGGTNGTKGESVCTGFAIGSSIITLNGGRGGSGIFGAGGIGGRVNVTASSDYTIGGDAAGYGAGGGGGGMYFTGKTGVWTRGGSGSNGIIIIEW